jgi:hypothetical protein
VYNARTHAPTSRISYICMNNAQETQNTNVLVHVVIIFRVFHKTRTGIVCACRRSLGPTDSHERVSIFISLYYLLTFSPRNRFFFHGPLLHTPFIIQKKKGLCVCGYYFIHNIYVYERVEGTKNLSSLRRKKHATVTHPVKGLHKIYTYYIYAVRLPGGEKKCTHDTHDPQEYVNINYLKGMLRFE